MGKEIYQLPKTEWGERLTKIRPALANLWCQGNEELLREKKFLAIVGSRKMTEYGRRVLETIIPELAAAGAVIVSGMMYGVDQEAHRLCLKYGGKTIAVLGWGIRWDGLAREDAKMQAEIVASGGLLVSEWESEKPELWTFPARNRIVAGLADRVLVVEAAIKSGSMVTVAWAEKFDRPVLAIPGPITSRVSQGTNYLIASGRARMAVSAEDILVALDITHQTRQLTMFGGERGHSLAGRIIELLGNEPLMTDDLARKLREPVSKIGETLTTLSLTGAIEERGGRHYLIGREE
ncbi:DNA-protecting protein DprA [Candidatus Collierbacteria bacterium]|nr:DNA-protecting protein DprA [Candidatus Collierbacteria bacterium]